VRQYGTATAMDDLDAVRAALGYPQLDVYGASYGATAAQIYLKRHPAAVRTMILDGATAIDVPFWSRFATNGERALAQVEKRCAADADCAKTFRGWRAKLTTLARAWDAHPVHNRPHETTTGVGLASVVQSMLLNADAAARIPLVVDRAAAGDYRPLNRYITDAEPTRLLMYWSIWCNEPWVGLAAKGPWHTVFDRYTATQLATYNGVCAFFPKWAQPASLWSFPRSRVPLLVLAGGADPQDPLSNLPRLRQALPASRAVVVPFYGHTVGQYGCLGDVVSRFVVRGAARGLDTSCTEAIVPPVFPVR
jgi:pimeloyl-ACP methyl ester carboxylesterase